MISDCGLEEWEQLIIIQAIQRFSSIDVVRLYGSRAKGNYRRGSDVDLAIQGEQLSPEICAALHDVLEEETPLPYFFDVTDLNRLQYDGLREHIERVGKTLYSRSEIVDF
jgi:predicted nucleotidyltransferase